MMLKIVGGFILAYTHYYIISDVLKSNTRHLDSRKIILLALYSILMITNYLLISGAIRLITGLIIVVLILKLIFKETLYKTFSLAIICYILTALSELFFTFLLLVILKIQPEMFMNQMTGNLLSNIFISTIIIIIYKNNQYTIQKIAMWFHLKRDKILTLFTVLILFIIGTFFFQTYNNGWEIELSFYLNSVAILIFCMLIFMIYKERSASNKLNDEYIKLFEYVKTGEKLIEEYHKIHHEHLNQLSIIKDLEGLKKKQYINKIIKCDTSQESSWVNNLQLVPAKGLKGLLHYKISKMKSNKITVNLNINECFLEHIKDDNLYYDVCQIIGIYLDNAIEETIRLDIKEIGIEIYTQNCNTHISIMNTCQNDIELYKLTKQGYTTKTDHGGLGLYLVDEIIRKNTKIKKTTKLQENYFVQELIIQK